MTNLMKYNAADLDRLMDKITRNSIGMDEYFNRLFHLHETTSNYPPYNLVQVNNVESRLELALAGFKKKEVYVYTQDGKLFVEGQKKQSNRYNRMDQATAKAMPMTDNPYINKKIIKARLQPKQGIKINKGRQ